MEAVATNAAVAAVAAAPQQVHHHQHQKPRVSSSCATMKAAAPGFATPVLSAPANSASRSASSVICAAERSPWLGQSTGSFGSSGALTGSVRLNRLAGKGGAGANTSSGGGRVTMMSASSAADAAGDSSAAASDSTSSSGLNPALVTGFFFLMWYLLNVIFNILNKKIYNYFPYPWFVSTVHLLVGVSYCVITWTLGITKRAPLSNDQLKALIPVAFCHALGHVMSNVSFNAVAVSFTHTIKALEPFFSAAASQFILGQNISLPIWLSLAPVVFGVSMASMTELSFNWIGFLSAMTSNVAFTYRNIFSKKAMTKMDSTNLYAYISILSLAMCIPPTLVLEGPVLLKGISAGVAKVGAYKFYTDLFWVGMFYHLYNQLANNTLERVAPLTHAVGNVLKRVFVIGFSILVFGNKISTITGIGTVIAIGGVTAYSLLKAKEAENKLKTA
ncbi:hypothetical protein CBR_g3321 [Chara braunii]|uniref:Sugar phosphate transporter domain-containing protein n=1 Tax=Chara braunii TaxID=69332 RepID=A0A388KFH5_CHABU|nr:hypothetical protein CBR_g3321 [Chara braunii]|eukprot:GBG68781.1 hypothetical protein CBR_g3321 [Chara braunii]